MEKYYNIIIIIIIIIIIVIIYIFCSSVSPLNPIIYSNTIKYKRRALYNEEYNKVPLPPSNFHLLTNTEYEIRRLYCIFVYSFFIIISVEYNRYLKFTSLS